MSRAKKAHRTDEVRVVRRQTVAGGPVELVRVGVDQPNPDEPIPYVVTSQPVEAAIRSVCDDLAALLVEKNRSYGNSALEPLAVMSKLTARERLAVRIDDKLSRIARGHEYPGDDTLRDLAGYLVLALVERKMGGEVKA